jgi:hypothetical protein
MGVLFISSTTLMYGSLTIATSVTKSTASESIGKQINHIFAIITKSEAEPSGDQIEIRSGIQVKGPGSAAI